MKLVIIIPCKNESETITDVIRSIPAEIDGVDEIESLLVDDASDDGSAELARQAGVTDVVSITRSRGLTHVYRTGMAAALERGANLIGILDGDNQYVAEDMKKLVPPLLDGSADVVIGERPIEDRKDFSPVKKLLQRFGSSIVSSWFNLNVPDVASGMRVYSQDAILCLNLRAKYTSSIESLVQCGDNDMTIISVPIRTNPVSRPSRLMKNSFEYVRRQAGIILRLYLEHRPFRFFGIPAAFTTLFGLFFWIRFFVFYLMGRGNGHVQSLVIGSAFVLIGLMLLVAACLAQLSGSNRRTQERIYRELRRQRYSSNNRST